MIATDGNPFEKMDVQSFNIFAGERFDFVLNASLPVGNYWVRVRGLADCGVKLAKQVLFTEFHDVELQNSEQVICVQKLTPCSK